MKNFKSIAFRWLILLLILLFVSVFAFYRLRPIIIANAAAKAKNVMTNAANEAIASVFKNEKIDYDDIAVITQDGDGGVKSIKIDVNKANVIKSLISKEIYGIISKEDYHTVGIPLGDFLFNDYTNGIGPKIVFRMELAHSENIDFKSGFTNAGINNVYHQISLNIEIYGSILVVGATKKIKIKTSALIAQTVIGGDVPESFTNVLEYPGSDTADDIFNYADNN